MAVANQSMDKVLLVLVVHLLLPRVHTVISMERPTKQRDQPGSTEPPRLVVRLGDVSGLFEELNNAR